VIQQSIPKETDVIQKPSDKEDEYFARIEFEKKKKLEHEKNLKMAADEKKRLQELHFMHCPKCGVDLIEIDHKGIKVDRCPECDGVWLDANEVEHFASLEKSAIDRLFHIFRR
jgi:uncharacterized protein